MFYTPGMEEKDEVTTHVNPSCWKNPMEKRVEELLERDDGEEEGSPPFTRKEKSTEGQALIMEEEKCYLCMRYILPSAEPFTVLPCYDSCRSKFHFLCIVNTLWHFPEAELICPICTDPRHGSSTGPISVAEEYGPFFRDYLKDTDGVNRVFLEKLIPLVLRILGNRAHKVESIHRFTEATVCGVRDIISNGASSIYDATYGTGGIPPSERRSHFTDDKIVYQMMRSMEFSKLLTYGMSVTEIYLFLTRTFRGLLFMKFSLRDVKRLEEMDQLSVLVRLYKIRCDDLRAVFGSQMNIQNLLSFGWSAKTFQTLGIDMHQLCVLRLQKDHIPYFGFTLSEWMNELRMTKTVIKILRIHANDFRYPGGKLLEAGWNLGTVIRHLDISVEETIKLQLNGYSSCFTGSKEPKQPSILEPKPKRPSPELLKGLEESEADYPKEDEKKRADRYKPRKKKIYHYNPRHSPSHHNYRQRNYRYGSNEKNV